MDQKKKTTYAMHTSHRPFQIEEEIRTRHATHIIADLPPDSSKLEEEEQPVPMEEYETGQSVKELVSGFIMEYAMVEFAVAQSVKMAEQQAILDP